LAAELAEAAGDDTEAEAWATIGTGLARQGNDEISAALLVPPRVVRELEQGGEETVLRELLIAGRALSNHDVEEQSANPQRSGHAKHSPDQFAVICGLLPAVLRLGTMVVAGSADARPAASQMSAACNVVADSSAEPMFWREAAAVIEEGFVLRVPAIQLVARVEKPRIVDTQLATAIRSIGYLAASLETSMAPTDALRAHLAVIPWLEPGLAPHARLYRGTLSRFLLSYWRATFDRARFRFGVPRLLDAALIELAALPPSRATRPLVSELVTRLLSSLSVRPDAGTKHWLGTLHGTAGSQ
jgi:hypothetical protein